LLVALEAGLDELVYAVGVGVVFDEVFEFVEFLVGEVLECL
jgi:hypothetical protein